MANSSQQYFRKTDNLATEVGILLGAAWFSVPAQGEEIESISVLLAGAAIDVGPTPWVRRDGLPDVRPTPVSWLRRSRRARAQGFQALRAAGIHPVVQPVILERDAKELNLGTGRRDACVSDPAEDLRSDQSGEQTDHYQNDYQLDERESGSISGSLQRGSLKECSH